MKLDPKWIVIIVLTGACIALLVTLQYTAGKIASIGSALAEKDAQIAYRTAENGRIIAEKQAAEIRASDLAKAYPEVVEELKKEFDIKLKDVKAYVRHEIQAQGKGEGSTINYYYTDSTGVRRFQQEINVSDGYLQLDAVILDTNRYTYSYLYTDTITTVLSTKRKWFLGNEKLFATTRLRNPSARVTNTTNVLINDHRDKRFVLSAGAYYDPFRQNYGVGVHFGYALIKF